MKQIDKAIEILTAFNNGEIIQFKVNDTWITYNESGNENFDINYLLTTLNSEWRVKPVNETRPYLSTEEFIKNAIQHNNWIKSPYGDMLLPVNVDPTHGEVMFTDEQGNIGACHCYWKSFEKLLDEDYRWFDDNTVLGEFE